MRILPMFASALSLSLIGLPAIAQTSSPTPAASTAPSTGPSPYAVPAPATKGTPSPEAIRAAADATKEAKAVLLEARNGSKVNGTVSLTTIGRTRTRVTVRIPDGGNYALMLHPGTDCSENTVMARSIALAPLNSAAPNAPESQTIVELPIEKLQSGEYVVEVRNATNNDATAQACAKLTR